MQPKNQNEDSGRREALKKIALGAGTLTAFPIWGQGAPRSLRPRGAGQAHGHEHLAASTEPDPNWKPLFFDEHQNETVVALSDLIIPETDTPGAKAALVNRYIDLALHEEDLAKRKPFIEGLAWLDGRSLKLHEKPFVALSPQQQTALLTPLADPENRNPEDKVGVEFFQQVKDLTIFAYYTSQIGMEQELEYRGDDYHTEFPGACTHSEHQT